MILCDNYLDTHREHELGRGGMGVVYLAHDRKLKRAVAIKTLSAELAGNATVRERFLREATIAARLSHPGIVPVYESDEWQGQAFFVMEYVEGESLTARLATTPGGRLDPVAVVAMLRDVAGALGYAHAHDVIHRDVTAENILIAHADGRVFVTDFGIAVQPDAAPLTAVGHTVGTAHYVPPERLRRGPYDGRSDIYSLGVVGYFALSGRLPFSGSIETIIAAQLEETPVPLTEPPASVPARIAEVFHRCLEKHPDMRYVDCDDLIAGLDEAVGDWRAGSNGNGRKRPSARPVRNTPLVSRTEADAILARAAELDDRTGSVPLPPVDRGRRDSAEDAARTSGFRPDQLRDAAREVGIGTGNVDQALDEHGLGAERGTRGGRTGIRMVSERVIDAGAPSLEDRIGGGSDKIGREVVLNGILDARQTEAVVTALRTGTGEPGTVQAFGNRTEWHTGDSARRQIRAIITTSDGQTVIAVHEWLRRESRWRMPVGVACTMAAPVVIVVGLGSTWTGGVAMGLWAATAGGVWYAIARVFRGARGRREADVRELVAAAAEAGIGG